LESSLVRDSSNISKKGYIQGKLRCLEAPQGATERNPSLHGVRETPTTWEERLSPSSLSLENLAVLTEKVVTLGLQSFRKNRSGAAKKITRKARLAEAPAGNSDSGRPQTPRSNQPQILHEPENLGPRRRQRVNRRKMVSVHLGLKIRRARGPPRAQVRARGHPGALLRAGRRRASSKLGNQAMPEPLGRAFGWLLCAMAIRRFRSPGKLRKYATSNWWACG